MKRLTKRLAAVALLTAALAVVLSPALYAAGLWWGFPQIGGAAYCVGYSLFPTSATTPGTLPTANQCNATAPAGPTVFTGNEAFPVDIYGPAAGVTNSVPSQAYVGLPQVGQGPYQFDIQSTTTATIANNTPWFISVATQPSAFTITMPSAPIEGQIQRIICDVTTAGTMTVAANTGQTLRNNPNAVCTAGTNYGWRYVAASTTWYRFQ